MGKKVFWVIKNFSSLQSEKVYSDPFVRGGCKWQLLAYPKGNDVDYLSLYLEDVADCESLDVEWRRKTVFRLTVVNQHSEKRSVQEVAEHWFDGSPREWGFESMIPLTELHAEDSGFLVNEKLRIEAEVIVLDVIGGLDGPRKSGKATKMLSKTKESMDVNGFQILLRHEPFITSTEKQVGKKFFVWVIKDFSFLNLEKCYSDQFVIRGFKWHLLAECDLVFLNLFLCIADCQSLPSQVVKVRLTILNQLSERLSICKDSELCFDEQSRSWGYAIPSQRLAQDGGFLVNGELIIVAEVVGTSEAFEESIPLRKIEVNGFHVLPSQLNRIAVPATSRALQRRSGGSGQCTNILERYGI